MRRGPLPARRARPRRLPPTECPQCGVASLRDGREPIQPTLRDRPERARNKPPKHGRELFAFPAKWQGSAGYAAGRCRHAAPAFGACCAALGVPLAASRRLFLWLALRNLVQSAVRLGVVGPLEVLLYVSLL